MSSTSALSLYELLSPKSVSSPSDVLPLSRLRKRLPNYTFTLILDLDGTLILENPHNRNLPISARNDFDTLFSLLKSLSDSVEVMIWTAAQNEHVTNFVNKHNMDPYLTHIIYRKDEKASEWGLKKDMSSLPRDYEKCLFVDNRFDVSHGNFFNYLKIKSYEEKGDCGKKCGALKILAQAVEKIDENFKQVKNNSSLEYGIIPVFYDMFPEIDYRAEYQFFFIRCECSQTRKNLIPLSKLTK